MNQGKLIILGSGGFISSEVVKILNKKKKKFELIPRKKIDLTRISEIINLKKHIKKNDIILFIAAKAPAKNIQMFYSNIKMVLNFSSIINQIKFKKLVYISSDAVYSDNKKKITENSKKEPKNWHGLMHLTRENILKGIINDKKLLILRPTLIYGKNDPHNGYGPNKFFRQAIKKKEIKIFGNGEELRDHIWVTDLSKIIFKMLYSKLYGDFNLVTGKLISFYKIANIFSEIYKVKITKLVRKGKMPHKGYRPISNAKLLKHFPNFKFQNIKNIIKNY
tara:strand:- start:545 stop:1378 length:834 start_codon:yes stop_codon:yes gene_type:complete